MRLSLRWWAVWIPLITLPAVIFAALMLVPGLDRPWGSMSFHFYVVSATAAAAAVASLLIIGLMKSLRETRLALLGFAFLSIAAIFAVHGLTTPGHIHAEPHAELRVSSWLSVFAGALFVAASAITMPASAERWFRVWGKALVAAVALALGVYVGLAIAVPDWLGWLPVEEQWLQLSMTAATMSLLVFGAWRYFQAFLFARLISQWAMVAALGLLLQVQVSLTWGEFWNFSWWLYHATYAAAFVVLFCGWFIEVRRAGSVRVLSEALTMRDAISQLAHGHSRQIAELVDAIEFKDLYTLGHVRRVANVAVIIGKEMGLGTLELRSLALGAQMHDLGKIGVPDRILLKPGRLSSDEFSRMREHAALGHKIASQVSALQEAQLAIRHHHERVDGSGYPDGLKGDEIPLHARIIAVSDAFDAMTSGRVYQGAKGRQEAIAELRRGAGTHFDARCVEAFVTALDKVVDDWESDPESRPSVPAAA